MAGHSRQAPVRSWAEAGDWREAWVGNGLGVPGCPAGKREATVAPVRESPKPPQRPSNRLRAAIPPPLSQREKLRGAGR